MAVVQTGLLRFGVRSVAERWAHDFFVAVHAHAKSNARVRLLARFLEVRSTALMARSKSVMDPTEEGPMDLAAAPLSAMLPKEFSSPAAVDTYFATLSVLHHEDHGAKGELFPALDSEGVSWVSTESAVATLKAVFKGNTGTARHTPCGVHPAKAVFEQASCPFDPTPSLPPPVYSSGTPLC